jgi:hypothetical protein
MASYTVNDRAVIKAMIASYIKEESAAFLAERGDEDP